MVEPIRSQIIVEPINFIPPKIPEGTILKSYRLIQQIGPPNIAIYQAMNILDSEFVTLKFKSSTIKNSPLAYKHFRRKLEIMQKISNQNVAKILEYFETADYCVTVQEYCDVRPDITNIFQLIESITNSRLGSIEALNFFKQILNAMISIHQQKVVLRSIKPQHILRKNNQIKLCNIGEPQLIPGYGLNISPYKSNCWFTSPEALSGQACDFRSDLYMLGVILFKILWGHYPYFSQNQDELYQLMKGQDLSKSFKKMNFDNSINELVKKMLYFNPQERITFAQIVKDDAFAVKELGFQKKLFLDEDVKNIDFTVIIFYQSPEYSRPDTFYQQAVQIVNQEVLGVIELSQQERDTIDQRVLRKKNVNLEIDRCNKQYQNEFNTIMHLGSALIKVIELQNIIKLILKNQQIVCFYLSKKLSQMFNDLNNAVINDINRYSCRYENELYANEMYREQKTQIPKRIDIINLNRECQKQDMSDEFKQMKANQLEYQIIRDELEANSLSAQFDTNYKKIILEFVNLVGQKQLNEIELTQRQLNEIKLTQLYLLDCLLLNDFHDNKKIFDFHAYEMENEDLEKVENKIKEKKISLQ